MPLDNGSYFVTMGKLMTRRTQLEALPPTTSSLLMRLLSSALAYNKQIMYVLHLYDVVYVHLYIRLIYTSVSVSKLFSTHRRRPLSWYRYGLSLGSKSQILCSRNPWHAYEGKTVFAFHETIAFKLFFFKFRLPLQLKFSLFVHTC